MTAPGPVGVPCKPAAGDVVLVLPVGELCPSTVRRAAGHARSSGRGLTVAMLLPAPYPVDGLAPVPPWPQLWRDYRAQLTVAVARALASSGVNWQAAALLHPRRTVPALLHSVSASFVLVHEYHGTGRLSPRRRGSRKLAAALASHTTVPVRLFCADATRSRPPVPPRLVHKVDTGFRTSN